jgi:hypothetical protein
LWKIPQTTNEDFSLQEVFRDVPFLSFFLAGKQHNEPFSLCSGQFRGKKGLGYREISLKNG